MKRRAKPRIEWPCLTQPWDSINIHTTQLNMVGPTGESVEPAWWCDGCGEAHPVFSFLCSWEHRQIKGKQYTVLLPGFVCVKCLGGREPMQMPVYDDEFRLRIASMVDQRGVPIQWFDVKDKVWRDMSEAQLRRMTTYTDEMEDRNKVNFQPFLKRSSGGARIRNGKYQRVGGNL